MNERKRPVTQSTATVSRTPPKTIWKKITTVNKVMTAVTALALAQALFCFVYGLHYLAVGDFVEGGALWLIGFALGLSAVKAFERIEYNANVDEQSKQSKE